MRNQMPRMKFRLSADLHQRLKKSARANGMTMSAFVRGLIERDLGWKHEENRKAKTA